jgi:hypothetical protein
MVIRSEDFYKDTANAMKAVEKFLGLKEFPWETVTNKAYNIMNHNVLSHVNATVTSKAGGFVMGETSASEVSQYENMHPETRRVLAEYFHPYNQQLAKLLQTDLFWDVHDQMGE